MGVISIVGQLILSLSILVVLHECGHFFPAKWFKTKVEKFYLFFNPGFSLYKKQIGETEYGLGWIPFGGYVKIAGMIDESMDTEQMKEEPKPWEFRSKPAWQRLIIMLGGVIVNFILGWFIFSMMLWYYGENYLGNDQAKYGVDPTEIGMQIGIKPGDKVVAIGATELDRFDQGTVIQEIILGEPGTLTVERDGREVELSIPEDMAKTLTAHENKGVGLYSLRWPQKVIKVDKDGPASEMGIQEGDHIIGVNGKNTTYINDFVKELSGKKDTLVNLTVLRNEMDTLSVSGKLNEEGRLGIQNAMQDEYFEFSKDKYSLGAAFPAGATKSVNFLTDQLKAFGKMFGGQLKASDSLGSIFSIANMFDRGWDWERFWLITAMLSILLGFFNLLPIPALDGGYVMFLLWEVITGKKPNDKFMEYATLFGFILLIGLMIFALGNDVRKIFF